MLLKSRVVILFLLAASSTARAEVVSTNVSGTFNNSQENACIHVTKFFYLADCFYSRMHEEVMGNELPWVGPTVNPIYYPVGSAHASPDHKPEPGDERFQPLLTGTLSLDTAGTPDPLDDKISGELYVGPAARSVVVSVNELAGGPSAGQPRAVMTWDRIVHALPESAFDRATPNDAGGFDYEIAAKGFPRRLCLVDDPADCFPSAYAGKTIDGQNAKGTWDGPSEIGITRDSEMEGNPGTRTSAVIEGYKCEDNRGGITCPDHNVVWSDGPEAVIGDDTFKNEGPGFDNLLLKVETDAENRIIRAAGFWTNEYVLPAGPPTFDVAEGHDNSFQGGYLQVEGVE